MIDTHVHLTEKVLYNNIDQVLENAKNYGVSKMICVGMDSRANDLTLKLSAKYNNVYSAVGIHPNSVERTILDINKLEEMTKNDKVVAIGEIGIDLYRQSDNLAKQIKYFKAQIELAIKLDLPVIIHSRNSADVIYDVVKEYKNLRGVMHCYSEHPELLEKFMELGFYIGVGGIVTFKNAHIVKDIAKRVDLDKVLIETDAPYLAPDPNRGKTNEPAFVKYTLEELAKIKGIKKEEMIKITSNNAKVLFDKIR